MTGEQFERGMKLLGYSQAQLADLFGVHRDTISARCKAEEVDGLYSYAMLGLLAEHATELLVTAVQPFRNS